MNFQIVRRKTIETAKGSTELDEGFTVIEERRADARAAEGLRRLDEAGLEAYEKPFIIRAICFVLRWRLDG